MKSRKRLLHKRNISDLTLLRCGLFLVLWEVILISADLILGTHDNIFYAFHRYQKMLEYIMADLAILSGGAMIGNLLRKDQRD